MNIPRAAIRIMYIEFKGMWNSDENQIQYIVKLNEALQQLVS